MRARWRADEGDEGSGLAGAREGGRRTRSCWECANDSRRRARRPGGATVVAVQDRRRARRGQMRRRIRSGRTVTRKAAARSDDLCRSSCCRRSSRTSCQIPFSCWRAAPAMRRHSTRASSAASFTTSARTRDIVLVDLRGTGKSSPLVCPELGQAGRRRRLRRTPAERSCRARVPSATGKDRGPAHVHDRDRRRRSRGSPTSAWIRTDQSLRHVVWIARGAGLHAPLSESIRAVVDERHRAAIDGDAGGTTLRLAKMRGVRSSHAVARTRMRRGLSPRRRANSASCSRSSNRIR